MKLKNEDRNKKKKIIQLKNNLSFLTNPVIDVVQQNEYPLSSSRYGILMGKVTSNGGVAIPNAKVSIFIESEESEGTLKDLYPYKNINDKNKEGYRYNLLKSNKETGDTDCFTPTGSFFTLSEIINDEYKNEIFKKYYKFNAVTNKKGDYTITNLPVGSNFIHIDVDISDIDFLSQKPYDLIANGASEALFDSYSKFSSSSDLDSLPQIYTFNQTVDVKPHWSQIEDSGITKLDVDLPLNITPTAFLIFGNFTDSIKGAIGKRGRPRKKTGRNCEVEAKSGTVTIMRRVNEDSNQIEYLDSQRFNIDENGNAVIPIPLNLKKKVTDTLGNLVPSNDPNEGIATEAQIRLKVTLDDDYNAPKKRTAHYLVPNLYNNYEFNENSLDRDFFTVKWNNLYTVQNYIPRVQRTKQQNNDNFLGIKQIGECEQNQAIPFNRIQSEFNILYSILCIIINTFVAIADAIDEIIEAIPFTGDGLTFECDGQTYDDARDWRDECVMPKIAEFFGVIEYEFYNDFLTGSLYHYKFKFKAKFKANKNALFYKYSAFNCRDYVSSDDPSYINRCKQMYIVDRSDYNNGDDYYIDGEATGKFNRGLIVEYNGEFFYAGRYDYNINDPNATSLNLNSNLTEKNVLLFATNLMKLGSVNRCSFFKEEYIVDQLQPTSFQEDEQGNQFLYNIGSFSACFRPNDIQEQIIANYSQVGVELIGGEEEDYGENEYYLDFNQIEIRRYLSENFSPYGLINYFVEEPNQIITDNNGDTETINNNYINNLNNNGVIRSIAPYYMFFGLNNSDNSLSKARNYFIC